MNWKIPLLFFVFLFAGSLRAQKIMSRRDSAIARHNTIDSNYVQQFPDRLIITLSESYDNYDILFSQHNYTDTSGISKPHYTTNQNLSSGISLDYDKISLSLGLGSKPMTAAEIRSKGNSGSFNLGFSFTERRFRFETRYTHFSGFYDLNTPKYVPKFTDSIPYYQNPSMDVHAFRLKTFFIFNKPKFSYSAAYSNTDRQVRSAGSWMLISNLYWYDFNADTSLISPPAQMYYGQWAQLNSFKAFGLSVGPGASYTLTFFHRFFFNITLTSGLDFQDRIYSSTLAADERHEFHGGFAGDFRGSLGLNAKYFFISLTTRTDYNSYLTKDFHLESKYISGDFNIGYRFHYRKRKWVEKMQSSWWYQKL